MKSILVFLSFAFGLNFSAAALAADTVEAYGCALSSRSGQADADVSFKLFIQANGKVRAISVLHSFYFKDLVIYDKQSHQFLGDQVVLSPEKTLFPYEISKDDPKYEVVPSQVTSYFEVLEAPLTEQTNSYAGYPFQNFASGPVAAVNRNVLSNSLETLRLDHETPMTVKLLLENNELSYKLTVDEYQGDALLVHQMYACDKKK